MSDQESWDKWNAIRKELDPKYRNDWKLKTWRKHWTRCLKDNTVDEVLQAFRYFQNRALPVFSDSGPSVGFRLGPFKDANVSIVRGGGAPRPPRKGVR